MYKKVNTDLNFVGREKDILAFWKENRIFEKSMELRKDCEYYTFYDGPPTANGKPHIGHVLTRAIKDMIPRYQTMKGKFVPRKAGWDTHGLPVELEVEKLLGLNGKEQIEEYGIEPFIKKCKESVWKYKSMWEDFSEKVGFWADMDNPYVTYDDNYIESIWWALDRIYADGKLFKGFKVVPYCPRCGTPLSAQEVAQGYKPVKEKSAIVRFKVVNEDAYFLAWTTTPWTLPSNVGLCVNPDEIYAKVKAADGYTYYMAKALLDSVLGKLAKDGEKAYEILSECKGKDLEYMVYEPLFPYAGKAAALTGKKGHFVICDNYVTMSDGTGIVHTAPAFGDDDNRVCRNYDMPFIRFVDSKGCMTEETEYAGLFVKKADPKILADLEARGQLFDAPKIEHDYPHCWRCDTPLIYYARESWFISMSKERKNLLDNNNTVNWTPPSLGKGRFGDWLENAQDWGISRDRYWGTPLNIWECESCHHQESVGGREDLYKKSGNEEAKTVELHRPYIDAITYPCPKCKSTMKRVPEVIDCWFDSGAMPFAQHHYPFENKKTFEKQFPACFISEAVDQTRGWFYSLMAEGTLLFDKSPYENVVVLGHVQDEKGQKMSKSKGNAVDPFEALEKYGADAIRWYFYINSAPWLPNRFHGDAVIEGQRKFMGTLWNTYAFYVLYAEIDQFNPAKYTLNKADMTAMDKWAISRLYSTIKIVDESLSAYKIPEAARALDGFVDDLSNWYVRRSRERFWAKGMEKDKIACYMTLYTCLKEISKAAAPMVPFMTEAIYQNIVKSMEEDAPESIHLCDFPAVDESMIDRELEEKMGLLLKIVSYGRAARNAGNIKNRQPLSKLYVSAPEALEASDVAIIKEELNIKAVEEASDLSGYTSYEFKPQLKTVGPKYGKFLGKIQKALSELDGNEAYNRLKEEGSLKFPEIDESVELFEEDLLINIMNTPDYSAYGDRDIRVVLYTKLDESLKKEGVVRELISKIQNMRKSAGFEVMDKIEIGYVTDETVLEGILEEFGEEIKGETLANAINKNTLKGYEKEWKIDGQMITLSVARCDGGDDKGGSSMSGTGSKIDKAELKKELRDNVKFLYKKDLEEASSKEVYFALSLILKDQIIDNWLATHKEMQKSDPKTVYYMSMEFLVGRALGNNLINLCAYKEYAEVLDEIGFDINSIEDEEPDPALGNGGLGRLAACFMDSLSTLGYTAYGCGIRYRYGMFKQKIEDGAQKEVPDNWLVDGYPFEMKRSEYSYEVKFGGHVVATPREDGTYSYGQEGYSSVIATPYDMPITGYRNNHVNTLIMWDASPKQEFSLASFDRGDYSKAVEDENLARNLVEVLYPNDNHIAGKELRLKQQYFFVSATLQRAISRYKRLDKDIKNLPEKVVFQMNDTHPTLCVPELMRLLMDEEGLGWDEAWDITTKATAYTNHTIMAEALEKWPIEIFERLLPRVYDIVHEIDRRFKIDIENKFPGDKDKVEQMAILAGGQVRMAHMAICAGFSVNGVAALHTQILKDESLHNFYLMYPEKFNNKTNGVTQRRFLLHGNPLLSGWITKNIGDGWITDLSNLKKLRPLADDENARREFMDIKFKNKQRLAAYIKKNNGIDVNPRSIFDVQVKRLHEYKRQLLNILHVMHLYNTLKDNPEMDFVPRTFIFGAKAAAGYHIAKLTIKLINSVASVINNDPSIGGKIKVVFIEDYKVSNAEIIFAASDVSEQISTASKEASGTGNMKFMMNGALTIGTMDGANVEMVEEMGIENAFIFGLSAQEVINHERNKDYHPIDIYNSNPAVKRVLDQMINGFYSPNDPGLFRDIYNSLINTQSTNVADTYFILADFDAYCRKQQEVSEAYKDSEQWARKAIINVASSGKFSSDRTIQEYVDELWHLDKITVTVPEK